MKCVGEVFNKSIHRPIRSDPLLPIPDAKVGIEIELEAWDRQGMPGGMWSFKDDGSLRNAGVEFVTNGGLVGREIREQVEMFCAEAKKRKFSDGEPRAGIHLHIDVTDLSVDDDDLPRLIANYLVVEHILFGFCGEWRRSCGYCQSFEDSQADFAEIGSLLYSGPGGFVSKAPRVRNLSKYQALNIKPLEQFGTLEFRHLPTTFDPVRIMTWISMVLAIKKSCSSKVTNNPLKLLSQIGPESYVNLILGPELAGVWKEHINVGRVWTAVDNATALMARGNILMASGINNGWKNISATPSPILEAKKSKLHMATSKRTGAKSAKGIPAE